MKLKMKPFKHSITLGRRKYDYFIKPVNKKVIFFECQGAGISQEFLVEDIPALLVDLPELIQMEIDYKKETSQMIRFRLTKEEKQRIQKNAIKNGYNNVSAFIRDLALAA